MARFIALPLYDHTSPEEIAECLAALRGIGLDDAIAIDTTRDWTELDGELRGEGERRPSTSAIALAAALDGLRERAGRLPDVYRERNELARELIRERGLAAARERQEDNDAETLAARDAAELVDHHREHHRDGWVEGCVYCKREHDLAVDIAEGERVPERVYSLDVQRELAELRRSGVAVATSHGLDRFRVERPDRFRDHAEEIGYARSLELLRAASSPIAGRDGWRRTPDGREWYSADWLGAIA